MAQVEKEQAALVCHLRTVLGRESADAGKLGWVSPLVSDFCGEGREGDGRSRVSGEGVGLEVRQSGFKFSAH